MAYEYRVAAFNENGQGPYTAPLRRVIPPVEGLPRPGFLTAAPNAEGNGIQLSWRDFTFGEAGFEIQRAVVNGPWLPLETLPPNDPAQD